MLLPLPAAAAAACVPFHCNDMLQAWEVKAGQLFRIVCIDGPQVADVNFWNLHNPKERFYASKTRQLHASHLKAHDR